jgi:hypothetical protein
LEAGSKKVYLIKVDLHCCCIGFPENLGERLLPQIIYCGNCKHVLYNGAELKPPDEVMQANGGYCPKCGKKLNFEIEEVEIAPVEEG